jgi:hypothetical protein
MRFSGLFSNKIIQLSGGAIALFSAYFCAYWAQQYIADVTHIDPSKIGIAIPAIALVVAPIFWTLILYILLVPLFTWLGPYTVKTASQDRGRSAFQNGALYLIIGFWLVAFMPGLFGWYLKGAGIDIFGNTLVYAAFFKNHGTCSQFPEAHISFIADNEILVASQGPNGYVFSKSACH